MRVTLWGTRGSVAAPGPETSRHGGNTSCVQVEANNGWQLILDAGTGLRRLGASLREKATRVDILLTHLHLDHIQGLGFFAPFFDASVEAHIWGPASATTHLRDRLSRYLSPPLFPILLRDMPCDLHLHDLPSGPFAIGPFLIRGDRICHPGPTVGYRIECDGAALAYLPDHEPALCSGSIDEPEWTSGYDLARSVDLLIHDAQYTDDEYEERVGWGHSSLRDMLQFASLCGVRRAVAFHHDPTHSDADLDRMTAGLVRDLAPSFPFESGCEDTMFDLSQPSSMK